MRPFVLALPLLFGLGAPAFAAEWLSSTSLAGFTDLSPADRRRIAPLVKNKIIAYSFEDEGIGWRIHPGDLEIAGSLDNQDALIVDGNLTIQGSYDDYGDGSGLLIVLGALKADHVFSWNGFYVRGALEAKGLVYGAYNDYAFEVDGPLTARGIVMDDHSSSFTVARAEFSLDNNESMDEAQIGKALRLLVPDVFAHAGTLELDEYSDLSSVWPDYEVTKGLLRAGEKIFRDQEAAAAVVEEARLAVAPESRDDQLLPLLGHDALTDRLVAARPELSPQLIAALLRSTDPGVKAWLAGFVTDLNQLGGVAALTVAMGERLVANPKTPEATLLAIAKSPNVQVRRTLAQREDLPAAVLLQIARDEDPGLRAGVLSNFDNAERLPAAEQARLAKDPDAGVRSAIAGAPLPYTIAKGLTSDGSREVRLALAISLAEQVDAPFPALSPSQREELAEVLFADADGEVAQAVFTALASARQVEVFRQTGGRPLDWSEIARATRSPELMAALLEREKELEIQGHLAENLALPLAVQLKIVDRAKAKPGKKCEPCFLYATPDDVLTELLRNVNLTPAALEAARALAAERPEASFASEVDDHYGIDPEAFAVPLAELAEKVRSAPTYDERQRALELYQQRKLRTW